MGGTTSPAYTLLGQPATISYSQQGPSPRLVCGVCCFTPIHHKHFLCPVTSLLSLVSIQS